MKGDFSTIAGSDDLCAWYVAAGVLWVQTRNPTHARRLSQRQSTRLVMRGVHGGYLRTFEIQQPLSWFRSLFRRYVGSDCPNKGENPVNLPITSNG